MTESNLQSTSRTTGPARKAVFLDRDGTINIEVNYLRTPEDFRLLPNSGKAIATLNKAGWLTVVTSNQSGVGRGYLTLETLHQIHDKMVSQLADEDAHLDAILFCPHTPQEGCSCRKPSPGMLHKAARELDIDLSLSWMVGDRTTDLEAGTRAGCRSALVLTGYGKKEETESLHIDLVADDLLSFVEHILTEEKANGR